MKKFLLKISLAAVAAISVNAQVINLDRGWTNVGIVNDTSIGDFNNTHIQYMWQYRNGQWNVFTPNSQTMEQIRHAIEDGGVSYGIMPTMLEAGSAVWILSDQNIRLRVGETAAYTSVTGVVKDALTHELISHFIITMDNNRSSYSFDNNGTFFIPNVSLGDHNLTIHADGFRDLNTSLDLENTNGVNLGQLQLVPNNAVTDINLSGSVVDATTGNPIEGVRLRMFAGYNNTEGTPVVDELLDLSLIHI
jgi:hypothetical protein